MWEKYKVKIISALKEIGKLNRSAATLSKALALGVFIGMAPLVGVNTILIVFFSTVFKLPIVLLLAGAAVTNPLTVAPYYALATKLGLFLLSRPQTINIDWSNLTRHSLMEAGGDLIIPLVVGTSVLSVIGAAAAFLLSYPVFKSYKKRKAARAVKKAEQAGGTAARPPQEP